MVWSLLVDVAKNPATVINYGLYFCKIWRVKRRERIVKEKRIAEQVSVAMHEETEVEVV